MNILLTGSTGYLGSQLAKSLTEKGHRLGCTVRDTNRLGRLERFRNKVVLIPTEGMAGPIADFQPEVVINTACVYSRAGTEEQVLSGNLVFPFLVMQAARDAGARRWINSATMLPASLDSYALSKSQLAQWGAYYAKKKDFQFINLLLEHFYGPDAPEDQFLPWVIRELKKDAPLMLTAGTQRRDFVHIDDVVNVFERALSASFDTDVVEIPVGTGEAPTIREVVEYLKETLGSRSELIFGAVASRAGEPDSNCDTGMMRMLGVEQPVHWKEGIGEMVKFGAGGGNPLNNSWLIANFIFENLTSCQRCAA